jgi:hypothetical protein
MNASRGVEVKLIHLIDASLAKHVPSPLYVAVLPSLSIGVFIEQRVCQNGHILVCSPHWIGTLYKELPAVFQKGRVLLAVFTWVNCCGAWI